MKIALLSGADKNAGDFLIVHRSKLLLKHFVNDCEIIEFPRNKPLEDKLDELNACGAVVFAGGPGYVPDMYPGRFPLVGALSRIKPPLFALGMGCRATTSNIDSIKFKAKSRELLDRLELDGYGLGCRDNLTKRLLESNGYTSAVFTGCPAWYDLGKVDAASLLVRPRRNEIRRIAVSDPAILRNIEAPKYLIAELRNALPLAEIKLVFHRGWTEDAFTDFELATAQASLVTWARENGVEPVDISYTHEGFAEYDTCDIHVGYRVHAHLYNVSQRRPSYLLEEDSRGYGANDALGCGTHLALAVPRVADRVASRLTHRNRGHSCRFDRKTMRITAQKMVAHIVDDCEKGFPEAGGACRASKDSFAHIRNHICALNDIG